MSEKLREIQIVGGPTTFDMLLGMYDYPREVRFQLDLGDKGYGGVHWFKFQIVSVTRQSDGTYLLAGHVKEGDVGFGTKLTRAIAVYSPASGQGTMTTNYSGKGIAVVYLRLSGTRFHMSGGISANAQSQIRFDLGEHKAKPATQEERV